MKVAAVALALALFVVGFAWGLRGSAPEVAAPVRAPPPAPEAPPAAMPAPRAPTEPPADLADCHQAIRTCQQTARLLREQVNGRAVGWDDPQVPDGFRQPDIERALEEARQACPELAELSTSLFCEEYPCLLGVPDLFDGLTFTECPAWPYELAAGAGGMERPDGTRIGMLFLVIPAGPPAENLFRRAGYRARILREDSHAQAE